MKKVDSDLILISRTGEIKHYELIKDDSPDELAAPIYLSVPTNEDI